MPFVRRTPNAANRPPIGSIPSPSAPSLALISTGVPSFDDILGGGQPVGSILTVLAPDEHSAWSKLVERYWIAQGLAADQDIVIIGGTADENGEGNTEIDELVAGCMWLDEGVAKSARKSFPDPLNQQSAPAEEPDSDAEGLEEESSNRTKIAWRYEKMKKFETTVSGNNSGASSTFHHTFNLTNTIPPAVLSTARNSKRLIQISPIDVQANEASTSSRPYAGFSNLLDKIYAIMKERGALASGMNGDSKPDEAKAQQGQRQAVRIVLHELGSLDWGEHVTVTHIHRFLHSLRSLIRDSTASVFISLPTHLAHQAPVRWNQKGKSPAYEPLLTPEGWLKSLGWASDACIEFQGFAGDPSLNVAFPHNHGLVQVHSLPAMHTLLPPAQKHSSLLGLGPGSTGQNNLAFKLKRKRLIIETLHLGVEGGVGERRTEPTSTGGPVDVRKMNRDATAHDHSHDHHSHDHHHHAAEGVDKPAGEASVRFAALNISMEDNVSTENSWTPDPTTPLKKERKKVSFIRHDKPELYEF